MRSNNQITTLLNQWYPKRQDQQWVLGTIFYIEGSSYRKPGAMMLFGDLGEQYGLLSGGCLESDLMQHARKVMDKQQAKIVVYDMTDEDDIGWQLGIGCGGLVKILLQPLSLENNYLQLEYLANAVKNREFTWYIQEIDEHAVHNQCYSRLQDAAKTYPKLASQLNDININKDDYSTKALLIGEQNNWLITPIFPVPHIMIFGGGIDAYPVVEIAKTLGWQVTLIDKRPAYARASHFPLVDHIIKQSAKSLLDDHALLNSIDGIVIMTHNIEMDGEALSVAQHSSAKYVGLLGPIHRRERILKSQGLTLTDLPKSLSSPIGLNIGGQLPESIALSIISECHSVFYR